MAIREQARNIWDKTTVKMATCLAIGAGAVALINGGIGSGDKDPRDALAAGNASNPACDTISDFKDFSTNAADYNTKAFLPERDNGIGDNEEVTEYVDSLFGGEDGPFGEETDQVSLAATVALVTDQATDKKPASSKYDYEGTFEEKLNAYEAEGGKELAQDDCVATAKVLGQVAEYDAQWAVKGNRVTQLVAVRDGANKVVGVKLVPKVVKEDLAGAGLDLRDTNKGLDGFNEALITEGGETYLKGVTVDRNNKNGQDKQEKGKSQKNDKDKKGDTKQKSDNGGGTSEGKTQGRNGESDGCGGSCGEQKTEGGGNGGQGGNRGGDDCGSNCPGDSAPTPRTPSTPRTPVTPRNPAPAPETPSTPTPPATPPATPVTPTPPTPPTPPKGPATPIPTTPTPECPDC